MNKYRVIDLDTWPRREMFEFYKKFDTPCVSMSVQIDAQPLSTYAYELGESFFMLSLYAVLRAANAVPQMRQRLLESGEIVEFERIAVMTPVMTHSEMFRQVWCEHAPTYPEFKMDAAPKVEAAKLGSPSPMEGHSDDFVCASCVPWLHFSSVTNAAYESHQSIPIITWGAMKNGVVPVSCRFNHMFVDGLHASRFFAEIERGFAEPASMFAEHVSALHF